MNYLKQRIRLAMRTILFGLIIFCGGIVIVASTAIARSGNVSEVLVHVQPAVQFVRSWFGAGGEDSTREAVARQNSSFQARDIAHAAAAQVEVPEHCSAVVADPASVVIGDRIRLRFFERAAFGQDAVPERDAQDAFVFERLDLGGVYEVASDGTVSIPLLGRMEIVGRNLECVETAAASEFQKAARAAADVSAAFEVRPPVILQGPVRAPGTYPYTAGLTVERLLAAAGSAAGGTGDTFRRVELEARRNDVGQRLAGVRLERVRAEAALAGQARLGLSTRQVEGMTEAVGARRIKSEAALLEAEVAARQILEEGLQAEVTDLAARVEEMERQSQLARSQLDYMYARRAELDDLRDRGMITTAQVESLTLNIMTSERFQLETYGALLSVQSALNVAKQTAAKTEAEQRERLVREIRDLAREENTLVAQQGVILAELGLLGMSGSAEQSLVLTVDRLTPVGSHRLHAAPNDALFPGDLVTVSFPSEALVQQEARVSIEPNSAVRVGEAVK